MGLLRALLHLRKTPHWLHLLNAHPAFSEYVCNCPRFLYKVYRPYISHALDAGARLDAIRAHYDFMFRRGLGQTLARASLGPVVLADLSTPDSAAAYKGRVRGAWVLPRTSYPVWNPDGPAMTAADSTALAEVLRVEDAARRVERSARSHRYAM